MNKLFILTACVGFLMGCARPALKIEKPQQPITTEVQLIGFGPPIYNTGMSIEELEQRLALSETTLALREKQIKALKKHIRRIYFKHKIETNAILNGKMDKNK